MKITDLSVIIHERPSTVPFPPDVGPAVEPAIGGRPRGGGSLRLGALTGGMVREAVLTLRTDEGIDGHTFITPPNPDVTQQVLALAPMLLGMDPLDIGSIFSALGRRRDLDPTVRGYVDVVLWDVAGKAAGLPVHRMLGTMRHSIPAYASSWVLSRPEDYVEEALAYRELGLAGYKIHPPSMFRPPAGDVVTDPVIRGDLAVFRAVREAVGDDYPLFADPYGAYGYAQAIRVGRELTDLGYEWYEDPLAPDDLPGYVRLKQHLSIPLMATEITVGGLHALIPWIQQGATDFLRGDVVLKGGITGLRQIAHLATAYHLRCELHDAYSAVNNLATVHLSMAIENCDWFEVLVPHEPGSFDTKHLSWGLAEPISIGPDGLIRPPAAPGLGVQIDWDLIRHGQIAELR